MPTRYYFTELDGAEILKNKGYILIKGKSDLHSEIIVKDMNDYKYNTTIYNIRRSKPNRFHQNNIFTIDNINNYIKINNISVRLISTEYINKSSKLKWECVCGNIFERSFNNVCFKNQILCKNCSKIQLIKNKINKNKQKYIDIFKYYGYTILTDFNGVDKKIILIDKECYKYETSYSSFKQTHHLNKFSSYNPFTIYNINNWIKLNNKKVKLLSVKYINSDEKLKWKCSCGSIYYANWNNVYSQNQIRCKKCSKSQSIISLKTEEYLINVNIDYKKEYSYFNCKDKISLPFDYAILKDEKVIGLIEVDGAQHFYPYAFNPNHTIEDKLKAFDYIKRHDEIKNKYCKDNNIPLLRIEYWKFNSENDYKNKIDNFIKEIS